MTAEDLYAFRFLTDAQLSPDGERVAFSVRTVTPERDGYRSAIWLVPFDGSAEATRLTAGPGQDTLPRWSPDGHTLAFVSDRAAPEKADGKKRKPKNIFVLPLDGGEARQVTSFDDDCGDVAWSPDGRRIAFTLKDARAEGADDDAAPRVYERMRYKTDEGYLSDQRRRHIWIVDAAGSDPRRLTDGDWDDQHPAWSPDGREIAFVSNRSEDRERNTVADIHVASVTDGKVRRVTDEVGQYGNPSWSPDGATIACYGIDKALGSAARNVHLWLWPAAGGGKGTDPLASWDRTVGSVVMSDMRAQVQTLPPKWSEDRTRLIFVGSDQGTANVYSVPVGGGEVRAETLGAHQVVSLSLASDARRFACVFSHATCPGDVAAGELGKGLRCLTDLNGELMRTRHIATPERVEFKGADGWMVEGWLMKPRGFDAAKKWPLVLEIHGGPHSTYGNGFFHEFQVLTGRGDGVL
jgi:dipeptidyl aminopeptidase/acylaminoacyl peptidase